MKWVIAAIAVFVVGYTLVNIHYRKPGPAFRPYEDMNNRATTARLLAGGWQKLPVELTRPVAKPGLGLHATTTRTAAGLGAELTASFAEPPVLPATVERVTAASHTERGRDYPIHFNATLGDQHLQIGAVEALLREREIVLIPTLERLPGKELLSRWNDADYLASVETSRLAPGRYTVRLAARGPGLQWTVDVQ